MCAVYVIFFIFFLEKQNNSLYFVTFIEGFPSWILIENVMIDTQETNLPNEENKMREETGKLEESQTPELKPEETTSEAVVEPEITSEEDASGTETEAEEIVPEEDTEPEVVVSEEAISEELTEPEVVVSEEVISEEATEPEVVVSEEAISEEATEPEVVVSEEAISEELTEPEVDDDGMVEPLDEVALAAITKLEIIERLKSIIAAPQKYIRSEVDTLKQTYYRMRRVEAETKKKEFLENGGLEQDFVAPEDETEVQLKSLIAEYKEKRAILSIDEERQKETNLIVKQHLIERLKILTESHDDFNKRYNEFRDIQRKWKEIRHVPQEYAKELWRNYQLYNERFYDIVKINNQFRDYDFRKNLEMKTVLCETVERLSKETDVISAFHQLQKLHQQWREIGPVAKEFRDMIWERFKAASAIINKRHQAYFDDIKGQEENNLERKEEICTEIESIDFSTLKTMKDWVKKTSEVIELQTKWRTIGFATKKQNIKVFERFRTASDNYFQKKNEFYKIIKKDIEKNLEMKKALVEKAEAMKDSTDWKETTKAYVELQSEWKKIGSAGRRNSETLWKQFITACDCFFERKNKESSSQKIEENENFEAKKALIENIINIDESIADDEALSLLRGYFSEWNSIGFVPFKEKEKLHKAFKEATDKQFDRLKVNDRDRRVQQFRSNLTEMAGGGKNKLFNERDKLMRTFDRMKNELQTYENNIGFISSKGGDGLLKEIDRKISRLKEEMEVVIKKIEAIDENLD